MQDTLCEQRSLKNRPVRMFGDSQSTRHMHTVTTTAHDEGSSNTVAKQLTRQQQQQQQ